MGLLSLVAQLGLDATGFQLGLKKSEGSVKAFSKSVNSEIKGGLAAAFGAAAIGAASKSVIDYAGQVNDLASRLGVSAEMAQALSYAIKQSGGSMEDLEKSLLRIAVNQQAALNGNPELVAAFERLGISAEDLKSKRFDQIFLSLSKAQEEASESGQQLADILQVLGKTGVKLLPAMREGLAGATAEAKNLGVVMSNEVVAALDDVGDRMELLKGQFVGGFGPALAWFADKALMVADSLRVAAKAMYLFTTTTFSSTKFMSFGQAWNESMKEVMDERTARETAYYIAANRKKEGKGKGGSADASAAVTSAIQKAGGKVSFNPDSLARVGGFGIGLDVGVRSLNQEARRHTLLLREIKANTSGGII